MLVRSKHDEALNISMEVRDHRARRHSIKWTLSKNKWTPLNESFAKEFHSQHKCRGEEENANASITARAYTKLTFF